MSALVIQHKAGTPNHLWKEDQKDWRKEDGREGEKEKVASKGEGKEAKEGGRKEGKTMALKPL